MNNSELMPFVTLVRLPLHYYFIALVADEVRTGRREKKRRFAAVGASISNLGSRGI
jgi:hypothetical protein